MLKITYHGHSCFLLHDGRHGVVIDPFLTGNPLAKAKAGDIKVDAVLVTHGHGDHFGDCVEIAKMNNALLVSIFEIVSYCQSKGVPNAHPLHIGGGRKFDFGEVKLTIAHHGSASPEGNELGNPCGILLRMGGKTVYHAGDTGLFMDMQLIGEECLDLAMIPIGGNFTMDVRDAIRAVGFLKPKAVVPMHYNTWPLIEADPRQFVSKLPAGVRGIVMEPGETVEL